MSDIENMPRAFLYIAVLISALLLTKNITWALEGTWLKNDIPATNFSSVEVSPWGIHVGTNEGIFTSSDLGKTWNHQGLLNRRITDIESTEDILLASTYYWIKNEVGLFKSLDKGLTWNHVGYNFSTSSIETESDVWYLGTYSHGLWISNDFGNTWEQKLGEGWYGPEIKSISASDEITIVAGINTVYKTTDHGQNFVEIPDLKDKGITFVGINQNLIFASSNASLGGLYLSKDMGNTWNKLTGFGMGKTGAVLYTNNIIYVCSEILTGYTVFSSADLGNTWSNTNLNLPENYINCNSLKVIKSSPDLLFASLEPKGLYRFDVPNNFNSIPTFRIPWKYKNSSELIDKITAFFDHKYPLFAYEYRSEPESYKSTTTNFLGITGSKPDMFYSSHNGTDFGLPLGTEILAPANGIAYFYPCSSCGNTIKIVHEGGIITYYMHLQKDGLVTLKSTEGIFVPEGMVIGKVGMTGNTDGPHLHLSVVLDANGDGKANNDYPDGRADPFGWKNKNFIDPWGLYEWSDTLGTHKGVFSSYMWKNPIPQSNIYINNDEKSLLQYNKAFIIPDNSFEEGVTLEVQPYSTSELSSDTKYINNTSFLIHAVDHYGNVISHLKTPVQATVQLIESDLTNIIVDTLKLYFFDEFDQIWKPLPSTYNSESKTLSSEIPHLSRFAVFGEKEEQEPPHTVINVTGKVNSTGVFITYPLISFITNTPGSTYFSINSPVWEEFTEPFYLDTNGEFNFKYKTVTENEMEENSKDFFLKVQTESGSAKHLTVKSALFEVNLQ